MSKIYGSSGPPPYATNEELRTINSTTMHPESSQLNKNEWIDTTILVLKASIMILIMVAAIFGNLLVIVS
ncbi:Octopamine receptor beta-2R [Pseudolycoriella hygida]|uniref:Octopamine receptor beta-2R n=1 Tax=Pseudolycoriella hygida TaxID=35572 RepID=A0A9Q0MXZ7_9DIPT|nr:Octopamine receptor beta-2R [Pseudolycoriella hygida]